MFNGTSTHGRSIRYSQRQAMHEFMFITRSRRAGKQIKNSPQYFAVHLYIPDKHDSMQPAKLIDKTSSRVFVQRPSARIAWQYRRWLTGRQGGKPTQMDGWLSIANDTFFK